MELYSLSFFDFLRGSCTSAGEINGSWNKANNTYFIDLNYGNDRIVTTVSLSDNNMQLSITERTADNYTFVNIFTKR